MKKVIFLGMLCLMALSMKAQNYVDLGLPSGTKWNTTNEKNADDTEYDFFTYDEAVSQFGNRLPTKEQWEELMTKCRWSWTGSGCKVTGPNGNSITLPAEGSRDFLGNVGSMGSFGHYWSSTPEDSEVAWFLNFYSGGVGVGMSIRRMGQSVRLVQD